MSRNGQECPDGSAANSNIRDTPFSGRIFGIRDQLSDEQVLRLFIFQQSIVCSDFSQFTLIDETEAV
jgi:hypothetical protein